MARTRRVQHDGIYYHARWPQQHFWPWFAGYFDGEGCIYFPPNEDTVVLSVSSTNRDVIESIHRYLGVGHIEEVTFDQPGWNTKYTWRLAQSAHVGRVLIWMREWLTIKSAQADKAWARLGRINQRMAQKRERMADVIRLVDSGLSHAATAKRVGLSRQSVSRIVSEAKADGLTADDVWRKRRRERPDSPMTLSRQKHIKTAVQPKASSVRLI